MNLKKFLICFIAVSQFVFPSFCLSDSATDIKVDKYALGQSLLNYYSINQIEKMMKTKIVYKNQKDYFQISNKEKTEKYEEFMFWIKTNDKNYTIQSLSGSISCNKEKDCDKILKGIHDDIKASIDIEFQQSEHIHSFDNKSKFKQYAHIFTDQSRIAIQAYIWNKETKKKQNWFNDVRVGLFLPEFAKWLINAN